MAETMTKADVQDIVAQNFDLLYTKLTKHFDARFDRIEVDISELNEKYDHLITTLDSFLKRLDNIETDNTARDAQLARLERWIEQIASKTGVKLEY